MSAVLLFAQSYFMLLKFLWWISPLLTASEATGHLEVFETKEQSRLEMIVWRFEELTFWGQKQLLSSMMCPTQRPQALNDDSYLNVRLTKWTKLLIRPHNSGLEMWWRLNSTNHNFCKVSRDALQSTPRRGHFDVLPLLYLSKLRLKGFNVEGAAGHSRVWRGERGHL